MTQRQFELILRMLSIIALKGGCSPELILQVHDILVEAEDMEGGIAHGK